jgi:hypothetical protein
MVNKAASPKPKRERRKLQTVDPNRERPRPRDLVARYGVTRQTLNNWRRAGILPEPIKVGNVVFWLKESIEAFERERAG